MRGSFFSLVLLLLLPALTISTYIPSYADTSDAVPYVYRIKIDNCTYPPYTRRQTGFQVQGLVGIVTALHGIADCKTVSAVADNSQIIFHELRIAQVDIDRDLALLRSPELAQLPDDGLAVSPLSNAEIVTASLRIVGYPLGLDKQDSDHIESVRAIESLDDVIPDSEEPADFVKRKSPRLDIPVLNVQAQFLPGHSGAPVLDRDNQVIAVGNGGLRDGTVGRSWAIPWPAVVFKSIEEATIKQKLAALVDKDPSLALAFSSTYPDPLAENLATASYTVRVVDMKGRPIANAEVIVTHSQGYELGITDSKGFYTFQLLTDADYSQSQVLVEVVGFTPINRTVSDLLNRTKAEIFQVTAVIDTTPPLNAFCEFAFRTLDQESGLPVEKAALSISLGSTPTTGRTDSTGYYSSKLPCPDPDNARVQVRVTAEGYEPHSETVLLVGEVKEIMLTVAQPMLPPPTTNTPSTTTPRATVQEPLTPSATPCPVAGNGYGLAPAQIQNLGCSAQEWVASRLIVTQQFVGGFMIVFDDPTNNDFQTAKQQRKIYVVANDGRIWRVYFESDDIRQNTSTNPDEWYTCDAQPGLRPANSGVPWRGFGLVWCTYPEIRQALGRALADEVKGSASFQSYYRGRVFQVAGQATIYLIYLAANDQTINDPYLTGTWQPLGIPIASVSATPVPVVSSSNFRANVTVICNDTKGQVWFEGTVKRQGQPVNNYQVVFKSAKVPGDEPATDPAFTGPHPDHTSWAPGYYAHIVDASATHAKGKSLQIWIRDSNGARISDYAYWETAGAGGDCNKAVINFEFP